MTEEIKVAKEGVRFIVAMDDRGIFQEFVCPSCQDHVRVYGPRPNVYSEEEMKEKSKWMCGDFEVLKNIKYTTTENGKIIINENPLRIEIGSGANPTPGYIHMDMDRDAPCVDIWGNIKEMPFENDTVDEFLAIHVLEHVWWADLIWTFAEINRIMKIGGIVSIEVPDFDIAKNRLPQDIYHFNMALYAEFKTEADYNYYSNAPLYLMHHSSFNFENLKWFLEQAGFGDIMRDKAREKISQHKWLGILAVKATKIGKPKPSEKIFCNYWSGINRDYPYYAEYIKRWG